MPERGGITMTAMPQNGTGTRNGLSSTNRNVWQR